MSNSTRLPSNETLDGTKMKVNVPIPTECSHVYVISVNVTKYLNRNNFTIFLGVWTDMETSIRMLYDYVYDDQEYLNQMDSTAPYTLYDGEIDEQGFPRLVLNNSLSGNQSFNERTYTIQEMKINEFQDMKTRLQRL
jgi:hypothetical protein